MANEISVEGMDELIQKLKQLEKPDAAVKNALIAGATIIKDKVKPKIPRRKSGKDHAADHIQISKVKKKDNVPYVLVGPNKGDGAPGKVNPYFYLKFLEWGTSKISALAMFGTTLAEEKGNTKAAMIAELKKGLGI